MKIGIDIQSTQGNKTGIGFYVENLINELKAYNDIELSCYKHPAEHDLNTLERLYWENVTLPKKAERSGVEIMHIPGFAGTRRQGKYKKITTVHDLIGMIYPENLGLASRFYWQKWLPFCVKNSDAIIAVSEHTKKDIVRLLGVPEEKVHVVLSAVDPVFRPIKDVEDLDRVRKKYNLHQNFILNLGTIEPRKNICGLIQAFSDHVSNSRKDTSLVIVGKKSWGFEEAAKKIKELGIDNRVQFTDYIEDEDLPALYNLSKFFVFPSFYEGFGFPVLEAMSCGKPVITSNVSSLPEIASGAAILIDPSDNISLSEAISELDNNEKTRVELSEKSIKRASDFSWAKTALQTIEVYRKVVKT